MRLDRICYLVSAFLAAMSIVGIGGALLAPAPAAVGADLAQYNCYTNGVVYWEHPCKCPLTTLEIEDFCKAGVPRDGSLGIGVPGCTYCEPRTCENDAADQLPCSDDGWIYSCKNAGCDGSYYPPDLDFNCGRTDKTGCTNTFGCANGTGDPCPSS